MKNFSEIKSRRGGCIWSLVKLSIVVVIVLVAVIWLTMGKIADYALGKVTEGTGIDAGVSSLYLNPFSQEVDVTNFYITNPPGYSKGNAFAFKRAYIQTGISPWKLLGDKLVTIEEIKIVGLEMAVELKTGGSGLSALISSPKSNLTDIADILQQKAGSDKQKESDQPAQTAASSGDEAAAGEPMKIIIKKIVFEDGRARGGFNGKSVDLGMPSFVIENIGVKENGLTPTEVAMKITSTLARKATIDVAKELAKQGLELGGSAAGEGGEAVKKGVTDALDSIFGK